MGTRTLQTAAQVAGTRGIDTRAIGQRAVVRALLTLLVATCTLSAAAAPGDLIWTDNFERDDLAPIWTSSNPAITGISTQTANSPSRSGFTSNTAVNVTSQVINLSVPGAEVSFWVRRGDDAFSEDPDGGENFELQYRNSAGTFVTFSTFFGAETPGEIFQRTLALPPDALHSNFQLRFQQTGGSGAPFDFWHFDDVVLRESLPITNNADLIVGECETFEGGLRSFDVVPGGGAGFAGVSTATFQSPINSAFTAGGPVAIISRPASTLFGFTGVSFYLRRGADAFSEDPDGGEDMEVAYIDNNGNPVVLETFSGAGAQGEIFIRSFDLSGAADAQHENFQIRFRQVNGNPTFDFWHIDDVCFLGALNADVLLAKAVTVEFDPINDTINPKAIPLSELRYEVTTTNQGRAVLDPNSLALRLEVPPEADLFVGDFDGSGVAH